MPDSTNCKNSNSTAHQLFDVDRVHALEQLAPVLYQRVQDGELTMARAEGLVRRAVRGRTT